MADEDYAPKKQPNVSKKIVSKKISRRTYNRPPTRKILRWNPGLDQFVLLGLEHVAKSQNITLPWDDVARLIGPDVTSGSVLQHLAKLHQMREEHGLPVPPRTRRQGGSHSLSDDLPQPHNSKLSGQMSELSMSPIVAHPSAGGLLWHGSNSAISSTSARGLRSSRRLDKVLKSSKSSSARNQRKRGNPLRKPRLLDADGDAEDNNDDAGAGDADDDEDSASSDQRHAAVARLKKPSPSPGDIKSESESDSEMFFKATTKHKISTIEHNINEESSVSDSKETANADTDTNKEDETMDEDNLEDEYHLERNGLSVASTNSATPQLVVKLHYGSNMFGNSSGASSTTTSSTNISPISLQALIAASNSRNEEASRIGSISSSVRDQSRPLNAAPYIQPAQVLQPDHFPFGFSQGCFSSSTEMAIDCSHTLDVDDPSAHKNKEHFADSAFSFTSSATPSFATDGIFFDSLSDSQPLHASTSFVRYPEEPRTHSLMHLEDFVSFPQTNESHSDRFQALGQAPVPKPSYLTRLTQPNWTFDGCDPISLYPDSAAKDLDSYNTGVAYLTEMMAPRSYDGSNMTVISRDISRDHRVTQEPGVTWLHASGNPNPLESTSMIKTDTESDQFHMWLSGNQNFAELFSDDDINCVSKTSPYDLGRETSLPGLLGIDEGLKT